jgi:caa(3)-type oxidase subunit IV
MAGDHADDVQHHIRSNIKAFVALLVLTGLTVAVSYLNVGVGIAIVIALVVASVKSSLVGGFFMHLIGENRSIYALLLLAAFFFSAMMGLFVWSHAEPLTGTTVAPIAPSARPSSTGDAH